MYSEDEFIPISALQHYAFCPRQCALIHVEQLWSDNVLTAEGRILHEKVHEPDTENRPGLRIVRGMRLHSFRLGLVGQADVVEFRQEEGGVELLGSYGKWLPYPVEFKRGKPKSTSCDEIQLCAQAICMEEMLKVAIPIGALFYGTPRRRQEIEFNESLREKTESATGAVRRLLGAGTTPTARYERKCKNCSMYDLCLPKTTGASRSVEDYLVKVFDPTSEDVAT